MHEKKGKKIECLVPASGLVTALEPVLKACGGTWIAHGSGDADREVVDDQGKIRVPPEEPQYMLKRVWLTKEEEKGYYYGFSNEGLWPFCHIAHTRPSFRAEDWEYYQTVNKKFAQATLEELEDTEEPLILIQDSPMGLNKVLLVTSASHMPRAAPLFREQGFEVTPMPTDYLVTRPGWQQLSQPDLFQQIMNLTPSAGDLAVTTLILKEYLGMFYYGLKGLL